MRAFKFVMTNCRWVTKSHFSDVIKGTMASQITIVYSTVYSGADQWKHQNSTSLAFSEGNLPVAGEFPAQMASDAEIVSIWWRHHYESNIFEKHLPFHRHRWYEES